jgi:hypothetical protein
MEKPHRRRYENIILILLQPARAQREDYKGHPLPEPVGDHDSWTNHKELSQKMTRNRVI